MSTSTGTQLLKALRDLVAATEARDNNASDQGVSRHSEGFPDLFLTTMLPALHRIMANASHAIAKAEEHLQRTSEPEEPPTDQPNNKGGDE
jgi:hypothetical protein